jgi:hypothetical protein
VTDHLSPAEDRLLEALADAARGPKRNSLFALWLVLRQCDGRLPPGELSERADGLRLERLERRLSSLSLPTPLRRALPAAMRELRENRSDSVPVALQQLVAPTREALGRGAADAVGFAARTAREVHAGATR